MVFKGSTKCACGKPGIICALDSQDAGRTELLGFFCTDCASDGIRTLAPRSWLNIMESHSPDQLRASVLRKYKVYSLDERANRASLIIMDGSNQMLCGLRIETRFDVLPKNTRVIDATFGIEGSPLEIELFEISNRP
jgi:hypothetical protein